MSHKRYFSYIRVSTQRQGQIGTSLGEQQSAIERYAAKWNLDIIRRFEERETAAKLGRPVFLEMLKALKQGKAEGVIIHKIDRSARNLKDWADLGTLIDTGLEVHFSSESLDLTSRGGRLSADIQAVVASDYIRNLREETKKGIYGRLKQGLYPFPAVVGYLDGGKGQPKRPDPDQAPLIRRAFELYATGDWGLIALSEEMYRAGLRNKNGGRVTINGLSTILHNPFYTGIIRIEKTGEAFAGIHTPIIHPKLYDLVQAVLAGKNIKKQSRHFFVFRRQIRCLTCGKLLIPELKKTYTYYRCHARSCYRSAIKEETLDREFLYRFKQMQLTDKEHDFLRQEAVKEDRKSQAEMETVRKQLLLQQKQIEERLSKLADAYIDGVFDSKTYLDKKNALVFEEQTIKEKFVNFNDNNETVERLDAFLELVNSAYLSYKEGKLEHRRDLVKNTTSELLAERKNLTIKLQIPFQMVVERPSFTAGSPQRETTRTFSELAKNLLKYFKNLDTSKSDDEFVNYITSKTEKKSVNSFLKSND